MIDAIASSLSQMTHVLANVGARGHLPPLKQQTSRHLAWLKGLTVSELQLAAEKGICPVCEARPRHFGPTIPPARRRATLRRTVAELLTRAFNALDRRDEIVRCKRVMESTRTAYVVGTGGSYPAAVYIAQLLNERCGPAVPIRPFDFVELGRRVDTVVVISYSGSTPDCKLVIERAKELEVGTIVIVTGRLEAPLKSLLRSGDYLISHSDKGTERGFVSVAGTVAPCVLWAAAAFSNTEMTHFARALSEPIEFRYDYIRQIGETLKSYKTIDVLGGGWAWPAIVDFETKLTEGGLGTAHIHEEKDFSHGRFILVLQEPRLSSAKLLFSIGVESSYRTALREALKEKGPLITVQSDHGGGLGGLEVLIKTQFLVRAIADYIGRDISKPAHIPPVGLSLYRWTGKV
jgi:fructoselysine-6-P-deglycase FrlB-like protein